MVPEPCLPWQSHVGMRLHCKLVWLYGQTCDYRGQQAQERPCWCVWPLDQPIWMQRGDAQTPTALFLGKEGIAPRQVDRESFCSFSQCRWAGWRSTALQPYPVELECCVLEQWLWNLPGNAGLVVGLCLLPHMGTSARASPKLGLMTSSTQLVLQCCDGKKSKGLTEAGS